ncbi:MAG: ParB/RepB/Spo0J family partition protein, partial [Bacilli bacterium]|nr:ParB/RepB/Spo0J family partition protein [Bacilli bacterium]
KKRIIQEDLSSLIRKFSQNDVIAEMEKEYANRPTATISASKIDDSPFLKRAIIPPKTIERFAKAIQERGIFAPLIVRPKASHYELVLGRKRFHGGKKANVEEFPCVVRDISDEEVLLMLLADIRDQRDANVVEMALIYEKLAKDYGYRQQTLADLSHQSRSQITNTLRILSLPFDVVDEVSLGLLSYGHAKAIACLSEDEIHELVKRIHRENLSVREVERIVKDSSLKKPLASEKCSALGIDKIEQTKKNLTLHFSSEEEKERFLAEFLAK